MNRAAPASAPGSAERSRGGEAKGTLRIGELARRTGLTHRTLRYYEQIGLLPRSPPGERGTSSRTYSKDALERLHLVQGLKLLGCNLAEIRCYVAALEHDTSGAFRASAAAELQERISTQIAELLALAKRVAERPG